MAEIEHFCDPADKNHPKFESIKETEMLLFSAANQMDGKPAELHTIGQAVNKVQQKFTLFEHYLTDKNLGYIAHNCVNAKYNFHMQCVHVCVRMLTGNDVSSFVII